MIEPRGAAYTRWADTMKFTAAYDVTPELQDASVKQFFWRILVRPRSAGILCGVIGWFAAFFFPEVPYKPWVVGFFSALLLIVFVMWVRAYFQILAQARAGLKLLEHPRVELTLDEMQIEYASSTGTRRYAWAKIDRLAETRDFVVLMSGKMPLLSLPKACLSGDALAFVREKGAAKKGPGLDSPDRASSK